MTTTATATPLIESHFDPATSTVTWIVADPATRQAAIVDSVLDYDPKAGRTSTASADTIVARVQALGLTVQWLLETHAHADHLSAAPYLKDRLGGAIVIGEAIRTVQQTFGSLFNADSSFARDGSQFDRLVGDGDVFAIGSLPVRVMHTPGHTPACVAYLVGDERANAPLHAFVGDTLFMPDYGTARCDFPGGDARTLYRSINALLSLPADTRLHLCHDYPPNGREARYDTTVAEERAHNIHVRDGISEDALVAMREARDATLPMPVLLLPSVQVNMRAGHLPPPEANGTRYLKIPLNAV